MAWRVDICDDEPEICDTLCTYLTRVQRDCGARFEVRVFHSAEALLAGIRPDTDLLLLDIRMDGMSGMSAARELRRRGSQVALIFITTMTQFAIEGYEVHAYGFLRKPLTYESFLRQMEDTLHLLRRSRGGSLEVRTGAATELLRTNDILQVEAYGHNIVIRLADGRSVRCSTPLAELEEALGGGFFRCHKSYLVNLRHIVRIDADAVCLSDGTRLPLSKHRRRDFLQAFARHREGLL